MYQSALGMLKDDTDLTRYSDGFTYRMWGVSERTWGTASEAVSRFEKADEKFNEIQREHVRSFALRDLAFVEQQTATPAQQNLPAHPKNIAYLGETE